MDCATVSRSGLLLTVALLASSPTVPQGVPDDSSVPVSGETRTEPRTETPAEPPAETFQEEIEVTAPGEPESPFRQKLPAETLAPAGSANAAEALSGIPGLVLQRQRGDADGVLLRGASSRLVATRMDGERLPSSDGESRSAGLAPISVDFLEAVTIDRVTRPELDGDAIGGAVDLITRRPPTQRQLAIFGSGGFESQRGDPLGSAGASYGDRWYDGRLGLLLGVSSEESLRHSRRQEATFDGSEIERREAQDLDLDRNRSGGLLSLELAPSPRLSLRLQGTSHRYAVDELRHRVKLDFADGEVERELKDAHLERTTSALRLDVTRTLGARGPFGVGHLDLRLATLSAEEQEPNRLDTSFTRDLPGTGELEAFFLDKFGVEDNRTRERDYVIGADLNRPLTTGWMLDSAVTVKAGAKVRLKDKHQDLSVTLFEPSDPISLSRVLDAASARIDPRRARELFESLGLGGTLSLEEDAEDYRASEDTWAGYLQAETASASKLSLLGGLRYEETRTAYEGFQTLTDEEGEIESLTPAEGGRQETFWLPMAQLATTLTETLELRAGVTRTLSRPDYFDLVPFELVDLDDGELERGNPRLKSTLAWNLDLALSWDLGHGHRHRLSVAGFHKSLSRFIYHRRSDLVLNGRKLESTEPRNGATAELYGVELEAHLPLRRLKPRHNLLRGLSSRLHLSWTDSSANLPERKAPISLPQQSALTAGADLTYRGSRFNVNLSASYVGSSLFELGESPEEDIYQADHLRLDTTLGLELTPTLDLFLLAENLTDEARRLVLRSPTRLLDHETAGTTVRLGFKLRR